jgi:hypothetical protein
MSKRAEFHQVQITAVIKIVDDGRSYGTQQVQINLLVDTDEEWVAAREQIEKARQQVEEQANANSD